MTGGDAGLSVDYELVSILDDRLIPVARQIPHHHFITFFDQLTANLVILDRSPAHMSQRCLPADNLWHHAGDQRRILIQLAIFFRVLIKGEHAAADRVPSSVVAAHNKQQQVAQKLHEGHVPCRRRMRHH
eukprot:CAMPEP_0184472206 /NCGR_PEP_ID=MMETSP0740-20130409/109347_1 /TAXON_ID=385413 /ORGANISM="Thalassiosira miniscula, Strain CCMP1093" /LENGTH=129 /DNA_ID=CAMNT_0026848799 /DNA_START=442 /DNA_END=832 /DNA_ORIENTATION=+